jgi:preprotein translocase subunit SecA
MMERLGMEDDVPIEAGMVTRSIENAQKRVEGHNFDIRKNLIEYDDVMNLQRKAVYTLRRRVLGDEPMTDDILDMVERVVHYAVQSACPPKTGPDDWDLEGLKAKVKGVFGVDVTLPQTSRVEDLELAVYEAVEGRWKRKQEELGVDFVVTGEGLFPKERLPLEAKVKEPVWRYLHRQFQLGQLDRHWRDHLTQMDHLRDGIGLRGYGSRDPKVEYKREAHQIFSAMMREVDHNVCAELLHVQLMSPDEVRREVERQRRAAEALARAAELRGAATQDAADAVAPPPPASAPAQPRSSGPAPAAVEATAASASSGPARRPGRNDFCWCGSGKKYKKCHLDEDERAVRP